MTEFLFKPNQCIVPNGLFSLRCFNMKNYALTVVQTTDETETELRFTEWCEDEKQFFFLVYNTNHKR